MGCELRMAVVSGVESGGEILAVTPFQSHCLGTWQSVTLISLSFAQCVACCVYWRLVVSGGLEVLPSVFNTCKNQTAKIPLLDTGVILEFICCCQNLSVKELGAQPWFVESIYCD